VASRLAAAALAGAVAAGCGGATPPDVRHAEPPPSRPAAVRAVDLVATPPNVFRRCTRSALLRPACPRAVPRAAYDADAATAAVYPATRGFPETFDLQSFRATRPRMVHVVLQVNVAFAFSLRPRRADEVLLDPGRRAGIVLGSRTWNARHGRLLLAPPYPTGGIVGSHLVFRWRDGGARYDLTLHAWRPLPEAVATLEAIVASLPPPA
jgi:hypothetical protein